MARRKKFNRFKYFILIMALFSLIGLAGTISQGLFAVDINNVLTNISAFILGAGLVGVSGIYAYKKFLDSEIDTLEILQLVTGGFGLLVILLTTLDLFDISFIPDATISVIQGISAFFLFIIIITQTINLIQK